MKIGLSNFEIISLSSSRFRKYFGSIQRLFSPEKSCNFPLFIPENRPTCEKNLLYFPQRFIFFDVGNSRHFYAKTMNLRKWIYSPLKIQNPTKAHDDSSNPNVCSNAVTTAKYEIFDSVVPGVIEIGKSYIEDGISLHRIFDDISVSRTNSNGIYGAEL